jgi:hypothetical protein
MLIREEYKLSPLVSLQVSSKEDSSS